MLDGIAILQAAQRTAHLARGADGRRKAPRKPRPRVRS
jgi:hypothetical protein